MRCPECGNKKPFRYRGPCPDCETHTDYEDYITGEMK